MSDISLSGGATVGCDAAQDVHWNFDALSGSWAEDLNTYPTGTWVQLTPANPSSAGITIPPDSCDTLDIGLTMVYPSLRMVLQSGTVVGATGAYSIDGGPWIMSGNPTAMFKGPGDMTFPLKADVANLHVGLAGRSVKAAVLIYIFSIAPGTNLLLGASTTQIMGVAVDD